MGMMDKIKSHGWWRITQAVVSVVLLILLGRSIDWLDFFHVLTVARWEFVLLSSSLLLIRHLINIIRWQYLLQGKSLSYFKLLSWYGVGLFGNNFLPTGMGGDGVRAALAGRYISLPAAVVSVGADRLIGFLSLGAVFLFGVWLGLPSGLKIEKMSALLQITNIPSSVIAAIVMAVSLGLILLFKMRRLRLWVSKALDHLIGQ